PSPIRSQAVVTTVHGAERVFGSSTPVAEVMIHTTSSSIGPIARPNLIGLPGARRLRVVRGDRSAVAPGSGFWSVSASPARPLPKRRGSTETLMAPVLSSVRSDAGGSELARVLALRTRQAVVVAQRGAGVLGPEEAALLQDRHHLGDERLEALRVLR